LDKNGFELTMGTNHLGHFYLTYCLWDLLKKAAKPRIVTVSSAAHQGMNLFSP
jgi:NAD(P)-dependent dehydrogenase (short-subunit alcohol dehydrogenase family)